MFLELIATIIAGIAAAGVVMLVNMVTGRRLPRWLMPVAAGAGMLAMTISSEYSWFSRTSATLPEGLEIAQTVESRALYRPWTYVTPFVERFVAVDRASVLTHPDQPGRRLADAFFFGRWAPVRQMSLVADCAEGRRALLPPGAAFDTTGEVDGLSWVRPTADDPLLTAICKPMS